MMIKNCQYRNCEKPFIGKTNKKYCCVKCKRNESKYLQREEEAYQKERIEIRSILRQFRDNEINPTMLELYNNVYGK